MKTIFCSLTLFSCLLYSCTPLAPHQRAAFAHVNEQSYQVINRNISYFKEGNYEGIQLSAKDDEGIAWLVGENFSTGTIEFDVKGREEFQRSFVGVAFHGQDNETYEAVYFRPFNFQSDEAIRRSHGVQYIAHPDYTWRVLRTLRTMEFENQVQPANIQATEWFHARLEVDENTVRVFVNDNPQPSLEVERIRKDLTDGRIGFWVGFGSDGRFANLEIHDSSSPTR